METEDTKGTTGLGRVPLWLIFVTGAVAALMFAALVFFGISALSGKPTPDEVVQDFREANLEVGGSYPIEEEPDWESSPVPKTYQEATRFLIPSLGEDAGGRVFSFESEEDLTVVRDYYESIEEMPIFGPSLHSHLYEDGLILVQINGQLPKSEADRYGEVLD